MRRSHRPTSLVLVAALAACFAAPVAADFNRGFDAWDRGQYKRAIREFRSAAERGDARAQNYLGQMYEDGQGLPEDIAAAVSWYQKAANAGEPAAQLNLGRLYRSGKGVAQSDAAAVRWYRAAAEQGLGIAQFFMGLMYDTGKGVPSDYVQAYKWFDLAARQGDADARHKRDRLANQMTPSQLLEAERQTALALSERVARAGSALGAPQGGPAPAPAPTATSSPGDSNRVRVALSKPQAERDVEREGAGMSARALSRAEVERVQRLLNGLGYNAGKPDGIAGRSTRNAVARFSADIRTEPFDLTDKLLTRLEGVKAALPPSPSRPNGGKPLVRRVQEALTNLGYQPGPADGMSGSKTLRAIRQYQEDLGLTVNDKINPRLLAAMERRVAVRTLPAPSVKRQGAAAITAAARQQAQQQKTQPQATKVVTTAATPASSGASPKPELSGAELIRATQLGLNRLGFNAGTADGVSGSKTVKAVKAFQATESLEPTGDITTDLYALIDERQEELRPSVEFAAPKTQKERVLRIQEGLAKLGFDPGPADGVAGRRTVDAVKRFQARARIAQTGDLNDKLLKRLEGPESELIDGPRLRVVRPSTERELVRRIQVRLNSLGYSAGAPDGVPGNKTYAAAKAFQRSAGMSQTGQLDQKLLSRLDAANAPKALKRKKLDRKQLVRAIQTELNRLGYPAGTADGIIGSRTVNAARSFQRDVGIERTGKLTPGLLRKLKAAK